MGFPATLWYDLANLGHEVGNHARSAAEVAQKYAAELSQQVDQHARPFVKASLDQISAHVAPNTAAHELSTAQIDWSFINSFGEAVAKQVRAAPSDIKGALLSTNNAFRGDGEEGSGSYTFNEENTGGFGEKLRQWIMEHPEEVAKLLACIAAGPVAIAMTPAMLGVVGFGPLGPIAGTIATAAHTALGPVAAGGAFAILTSAGMGGYGLVVVQALAASSAVLPMCSAAAMAFLKAMREDESEKEMSV